MQPMSSSDNSQPTSSVRIRARITTPEFSTDALTHDINREGASFYSHREVAPGLVVPLLCRTRVAEAVRPGSEMKWYGHKRVRFEDDGTETIEELKPAFREVEGLGGVPAHTTTRRYRWVGGQLLVVSEILVQDDKGSLLFAARFHHFRLNTGLRDEGFTAWTAGQGGRVQ